MEKLYIYIFTNPEKPELVKVGRTNKHPEIRANELSRQTGTIGKFVVEWHLEEIGRASCRERVLMPV